MSHLLAAFRSHCQWTRILVSITTPMATGTQLVLIAVVVFDVHELVQFIILITLEHNPVHANKTIIIFCDLLLISAFITVMSELSYGLPSISFILLVV
jgi:hypothetical protein